MKIRHDVLSFALFALSSSASTGCASQAASAAGREHRPTPPRTEAPPVGVGVEPEATSSLPPLPEECARRVEAFIRTAEGFQAWKVDDGVHHSKANVYLRLAWSPELPSIWMKQRVAEHAGRHGLHTVGSTGDPDASDELQLASFVHSYSCDGAPEKYLLDKCESCSADCGGAGGQCCMHFERDRCGLNRDSRPCESWIRCDPRCCASPP